MDRAAGAGDMCNCNGGSAVTNVNNSILDESGRAAYSADEIAKILGLSRATIVRLMQRGDLASVLIGGSRRVPASEIKRILAVRAEVVT